MKQNLVKEMFGKKVFGFIFVALVFSFFCISSEAATLLLPSGSNVNDVAADSITGTVYITKTDGTLHSSANGFNFTQIMPPPDESAGFSTICFDPFGQPIGAIEFFIKFRPDRINVNPNGELWAVMIGSKWRRDCLRRETPVLNFSQNFLFRYDGANWIKRENAPNPVDVGVSSAMLFQPATVYVTSMDAPQGVFYTNSPGGTTAFSGTGSSGFARVDTKATGFTGAPVGAWAVGYNGTLWSYARNVIQGSPWWLSGQTNVKDVAVNKTTGRVYISKTSQAGGTIWYSDDNGASFQQEPATGFQNLAVTSNGVLYGAGYNGSLWRF